jgi:hypothetical protein
VTDTSRGPAPIRTWPVWVLGAPAAVAIWSGWVGLGQMTGFGKIHPLPGTPLADWELDTAITLPIGMEVYAAYALWVWLSGQAPPAAARFARRSAIGALALGAAGQVAYHLMAAAGWSEAPWWITTVVACLPVAVLGMGAALRHLIHAAPAAAPEPVPASSPVASSPAPGEADTSGPGDGGRSGARPPQGRRTNPAAGRATPGRESPPAAAGPTPMGAAEAYIRAELAAGRKPSKRAAQAYMREHAGSGMRDEDFAPRFRELVAKHSQRPLHAVSGEGSA